MTHLNHKAIEGIFFFVLALALLLYLPAGTIYYWQATGYLLVFTLSIVAITYYLIKKDPALLKRRLEAGAIAEKEKKQKLVQFVAQFAFITLYLLSAFDIRFGWSHVPPFITILAYAVVVLGFCIVFLVFKENTYTSAIIEIDKNQTVITTGPYAMVRHPMYSGALVMLLATPPALGSWWGIVAFLPMVAVIVWRLSNEEEYLSRHLKGYSQYCRTVRWRLVPRIY